jgi:haloalkane dehalogenase
MLNRRKLLAASALTIPGALPLLAGRASARDVSERVLRTPDSAFIGLPEYDFRPNYISIDDREIGQLRMHFVDEGPRSGPPVVFLHGQPTWSFIFRRQIKALAAAGYRVLAPDLIGFGRSDKPRLAEDHTYQRHLTWVSAFFEALKLEAPTLVVHDWGGLLGLPIAAGSPEKFGALVVLNTSLPDGTDPMSPSYERGWDAWIALLKTTPRLELGRVVAAQTYVRPAPDVLAAYDAPFPDNALTSGPRMLSGLVPRRPGDPMADQNHIAREKLRQWQKPVLIAFSEDSDRVHPGQRALFDTLMPRPSIWRSVSVERSKHFLMEDASEPINRLLLDFLGFVYKRP